MAKHPNELMNMSDEQLVFYALSGDAGSYAHRIGETAMNLRISLRNQEMAKQMSTYTQNLADYTKQLAVATWGIVIITLATQIALIILTIKGR